MKPLKQIILQNPELSGVEHGMLRDFQDEIVRLTGAIPVEIPHYGRLAGLSRWAGPGTRYQGLRHLLPRISFDLTADVLWAVLMGPEDWTLDLYKAWDRRVGLKILYLFDTMESQLPNIRRVLRTTKWDLTVTSFQGAVAFLEANTQRKWFAVPQGVKLERFRPAPEHSRLIDFCAYGRRFDRIHESVKRFCAESNHEYQYTTSRSLSPGIDSREQYQHYAWHLGHAIFTFCWPVEMTNPDRVRTFSPITCRWFEAAASGAVVLGSPPADPGVVEMFGPDFVLPVNTSDSDDSLTCFWRQLWKDRFLHLEAARRRYIAHSSKWSWQRRVADILTLASLTEVADLRQPIAGSY